jgi:hypothetical protein
MKQFITALLLSVIQTKTSKDTTLIEILNDNDDELDAMREKLIQV